MDMNFEPHECVILVQSTKIGTHKNKAIHSISSHYIAEILLKIKQQPSNHPSIQRKPNTESTS